MNSDILNGQWTSLKGKIKETFGKLTDDDLLQMQGSTDRIVGVLQERYGYSKVQAQQEWDAFARRQSATMADTSAGVAHKVKAAADDLADGAARLAEKVADKVETAVKHN